MTPIDDERLDEIMDGWTEEVRRAAPELRPTTEMRRIVEARAQRRRPWGWVALAAAAVLVVVFGRSYFAPPTSPRAPVFIGTHAPKLALEGVRTQGPAPLEMAPKKRGGSFAQVLLQTHAPGSEVVAGIEYEDALPPPVPLGADDYFRLALHLLAERHVYVYAATADDEAGAQRLFPVEEDASGLLPARELVWLPSADTWYRAAGEATGQRLVVIGARAPLDDLSAPGALRALREMAMERGVDVCEFAFEVR